MTANHDDGVGESDGGSRVIARSTEPSTRRRELQAARERSWCGTDPQLPGMEVVLDHHDVRGLLTAEDTFAPYFHRALKDLVCLNPGAADHLVPMFDRLEVSFLLNHTGQRHRTERALFSRAFTPRSVTAVRPFITELTRQLTEALRPGDDFMAGFAVDVPALTLCEVAGIPASDRHRFLGWIGTLGAAITPARLLSMSADDARALVETNEELVGYCTDLVARRRAEPRDDLISRVANDPECPLDDQSLVDTLSAFIFAGNDTTKQSLGTMVMLVCRHPDVWDEVAAHPDAADAVVEECLRLEPAVPGVYRRVDTPTPFRDAEWPRDQVIFALTESANIDTTVFGESSLDFDPHRSNPRDHLTFGHGPHYCVGANLARVELQESLRALTASLNCPEVVGRPAMAATGFRGPAELRLSFERRVPA